MNETIDSEAHDANEQEKEPEEKLITFDVDGQKLEGLIVEAGHEGPFTMLLLGGGGNIAHQDYYGAWQKQLATIGVSSMSFDFRGVGASDGRLGETSLDTRLEDAKAAIELLKQEYPGQKIYVAGVSMGGPVALRLANEIQADGLLLVAPAAYSEEARHKTFGPEFTAALKKEGSWQGSPDYSELARFGGKLLVAYGDRDDVIPSSILERYANVAQQKGELLVVPNVGHRFMREGDAMSVAARDEVLASLGMLAT